MVHLAPAARGGAPNPNPNPNANLNPNPNPIPNPNPNPNLDQVGEPMRTRSQGPLAAGDLVESPRAAGPNAPQLIPHNAKRRGSSRHILPEQLSDRPSACVADWSLEQSMAC